MMPLPPGPYPGDGAEQLCPGKALPVIRTCSPLPISMLMSLVNTGPSYLAILRLRKAGTGCSEDGDGGDKNRFVLVL